MSVAHLTPAESSDRDEITALGREIEPDRLRRAKEEPLASKFLAGEELFYYAASITMAGIRMQHPEADERRVLEIWEQRLELVDRMDRKRAERQRAQ